MDGMDWLLGILASFMILAVNACSTVKIIEPCEGGLATAKFGKVKVLSKKYGNYFYSIELRDLAKLYDDPDTLEFKVIVRMKPPKGKKVVLASPFITSLKEGRCKDFKIISEKKVASYIYELSFEYKMEDIIKKIELMKDLILSVNGGEMFFIISNCQLDDLYKALVKKAYIVDVNK